MLGHDEGLTTIVRKAPWLKQKENPERGGKNRELKTVHGKGPAPTIAEDTKMQIAKEKAGGAGTDYLAKKYGVSAKYIDDALHHIFISSKVGRELLKNVILENGIACGMRARAGVADLSPMQAIMATGIMSSKFVELDKHTASTPAEVDFTELQAIGENMKLIRESLGDLPDDSMDDVIDID